MSKKKTIKKINVNNLLLSPAPAFSWISQATQYPPDDGKNAGISYFKGDMGNNKWVDCLLYRDGYGVLLGILNYCPFDFFPYEVKGNVNICVKPDFKKHGVATKLLEAAMERWEINFEQQYYTPQGHKFILSFLKKLGRI